MTGAAVRRGNRMNEETKHRLIDEPTVAGTTEASDGHSPTAAAPHAAGETMSAIFDAVVDGLIINAFDGTVVEVNEAFCRMHGYARADFLNMDPREFIDPNFHHLFEQYLQTVRAGEPFRCIARDVRKDGTIIDVEVHGSLISHGGRPHARGVVRDITEQQRVEAELQESKSRYADLFENAPDMIISVDAQDATILECNQTLADALGYPKRDLMGRPVFELYDTASVDDARRAFRRFAQFGELHGVELRIRKRDGSPLDVSVSVSAVRDATGNILRSRSIWRDVTERKLAERLLAGRNRVLEQLATGSSLQAVLTTLVEQVEDVKPDLVGSVLLLDENQCLRHGAAPSLPDFYNAAIDGLAIGPRTGSCGTAAYLGERVIVEDVMEHAYWAEYRELAAKAGVRACWSEPVRSSHGEILGTFALYYRQPRGPDEADLELIRSSAHLAAVAIEHKRAAEQLRRAHAELELRVQQRTAEIARANAALAQSNRDLQDFAYVASHDLQEPLRMVTSYCQLLQRRYQGQLDSDADEFIHFAVDGATRMQTLIADLLAYSRVESAAKPPTPTDCREVMNAVMRNLDASIQATGAVISYDDLPVIMADSTQLTQVLQNLVDNSIKYHGQAAPEVRVTAQRVNGEWLFAVRDNGIGINSRYTEQIFTVFKRLHDREKYQGTGLGLAICKRVVSQHGGRIWVESEPGSGSTFYFTLPVAPDESS